MILRRRQLASSFRSSAKTIIGTTLLFAAAGCPTEADTTLTADTSGEIGIDATGGDASADTSAQDAPVDNSQPETAVDTSTPETAVDTSTPETAMDTSTPETAMDTSTPEVITPDVPGPDDVPSTETVQDVPVFDTGGTDIVTTDGGPDGAVDTADGEVCQEPKETAADLLGQPCDQPFYLALCADDGSGKTAVYCGGDNVWIVPEKGDFCEYCNPVPCDYDTACIAIGYIGITRARAAKAGCSVFVA